ncbi:hypothetical protein SODALDRAFT_355667 [Sodiomyces alkalinus F11]|uniref:Uncharacterized protein n=1 Tax=Sodiomyces alkalinus (strain CBS 110278 / VKM F-3762 / F11) TaxID=1314773 RepID=A0A3N2Q9P2_SODAK|nr:hypothetical protein SODALDRAFT_355667 [Sodiomyces alkalinus F11]ROT43462.1 hypothetical protein SODALDRAFT_355667 [Sodiomyces alkalinus F11]
MVPNHPCHASDLGEGVRHKIVESWDQEHSQCKFANWKPMKQRSACLGQQRAKDRLSVEKCWAKYIGQPQHMAEGFLFHSSGGHQQLPYNKKMKMTVEVERRWSGDVFGMTSTNGQSTSRHTSVEIRSHSPVRSFFDFALNPGSVALGIWRVASKAVLHRELHSIPIHLANHHRTPDYRPYGSAAACDWNGYVHCVRSKTLDRFRLGQPIWNNRDVGMADGDHTLPTITIIGIIGIMAGGSAIVHRDCGQVKTLHLCISQRAPNIDLALLQS